MNLLARFKASLFPCDCIACDFEAFEPATEYVTRQEIGGPAKYLTPTVSKGETACIGGHEDWWLPTSGCPWCKATL